MNHLKITAFIAITLTSFATQASDTSVMKKSLTQWQPVEVTQSGDKLTVVLNENQITPTIYDAVITSGVCMDIWTKDAPAKYLEKVKELHILNKHKAKGYVLNQPLDTCNEMGKEQPDRAKSIMLSHTRVF